MRDLERETKVVRFLKESVLPYSGALSEIRFVFRNGAAWLAVDADRLFEAPEVYVPQIFDVAVYGRRAKAEPGKRDVQIAVVGGDSTLLNASGATNFVYRVEGAEFGAAEVERINGIATRTKIIDRVEAIRAGGGRLVFDHVDNATFRANLAMLDTGLAATLGQLLLEQFDSGERTFAGLLGPLAKSNPLGFDEVCREAVYAYKLKHLLTSAALGMMPSKRWCGRYDANGGYLVVKRDGEVLCYHFYDKNRFEDFLFANAYLERGKTHRHGYATLYRGENGGLYFKLNLQVRLK